MSQDWAAERELALSEFEETLDQEGGDDDGEPSPDRRRLPSEIIVEVRQLRHLLLYSILFGTVTAVPSAVRVELSVVGILL